MAISNLLTNEASASGSSGSNTFNVTIAAPANGNNLILIFFYVSTNAAVSSIVQTNVSNWRRVGVENTNHTIEIWTAENVSGAGTTVTVNLTANATSSAVGATVVEWQGVASNHSDVASASGPSNDAVGSTAINTLSVTPANGDNVLMIAAARSTTTVSAGPTGGFTAFGSPDAGSGSSQRTFTGYQVIASSAGPYQAGWTQTSATWGALIVTFSATPQSNPPTPQLLDLAHTPQYMPWISA